MVDLCSIAGTFFDGRMNSPFGGYFVREGRRIYGNVVDNDGASARIAGLIEGNSLKFRKRYFDKTNGETCDYSFELKEGLWVGSYGHPDGQKFDALLRINVVLENQEVGRSELPLAFSLSLNPENGEREVIIPSGSRH